MSEELRTGTGVEAEVGTIELHLGAALSEHPVLSRSTVAVVTKTKLASAPK